jgi:hypothetical protein
MTNRTLIPFIIEEISLKAQGCEAESSLLKPGLPFV